MDKGKDPTTAEKQKITKLLNEGMSAGNIKRALQ